MVKAARDNQRIVQTGSQHASAKEFRQACELVRNGALGPIKQVKVGLPGPNWVDRAKKPVPDSDPPTALDYEFWLGPAPSASTTPTAFTISSASSGTTRAASKPTSCAHDLDIAQWGLGMDDSGPDTIEGTATFNANHWFETPETARQTFTYADGVKVLCSLGKGGYPGGVTFEGEKGTIHVEAGFDQRHSERRESQGSLQTAEPARRSSMSRPITIRTGSMHQDSQTADLRCGDRPSVRYCLPSRQYRYPHWSQDCLGPEDRADRRRQGSEAQC